MQIKQHRPIGLEETISLYCEFAGHRLVEKGLEVDIKSIVSISGEIFWESTITFYYRGQFGPPDASFQPPQMDMIPDAPEVERWFLQGGVGIGFATLSGDSNPIHYWRWYARLSGFKRDFAQPLLILASSVDHLGKNHGYEPQSKLWKQFRELAAGYYIRASQDNSTSNLYCTSFLKIGSHYPLLRRIVQLTHSAA
jgi:hypothetical protein